MRSRGVTSRDVARHAGVSQSAVSLVLGGKAEGRVSAARAEAVRRAAAELGYRPNAAARALRTGSARAIGLAVPKVTQPFFGFVLAGAQAEATRVGHAVMLIDAPEGRPDVYERLRDAGAVDGMLWLAGIPHPSVRDDRPLVLMESEARGLTSVRFAVEDGFRALGEHLRALGHRHVAHLAAAVDEQTFRRRATGLAEGLGFAPRTSERAPVDLDAARAVAHRLLDAADPPTALVGDDDVLAAGAALAARDLGLAVPGDVSLAGMDDLDIGRVLDPQLTTVRLDGARLGAVAFRALATLLAGGRPPRRQVLDVEFLARGSTGPAPSR